MNTTPRGIAPKKKMIPKPVPKRKPVVADLMPGTLVAWRRTTRHFHGPRDIPPYLNHCLLEVLLTERSLLLTEEDNSIPKVDDPA